jgi:hypothetical protein
MPDCARERARRVRGALLCAVGLLALRERLLEEKDVVTLAVLESNTLSAGHIGLLGDELFLLSRRGGIRTRRRRCVHLGLVGRHRGEAYFVYKTTLQAGVDVSTAQFAAEVIPVAIDEAFEGPPDVAL